MRRIIPSLSADTDTDAMPGALSIAVSTMLRPVPVPYNSVCQCSSTIQDFLSSAVYQYIMRQRDQSMIARCEIVSAVGYARLSGR